MTVVCYSVIIGNMKVNGVASTSSVDEHHVGAFVEMRQLLRAMMHVRRTQTAVPRRRPRVFGADLAEHVQTTATLSE
jgi:hypothetical protein